jgi:hypothetical protein
MLMVPGAWYGHIDIMRMTGFGRSAHGYRLMKAGWIKREGPGLARDGVSVPIADACSITPM